MEMEATRIELGRPATLADLDALPAHIKGEIIEGTLYTMSRPRARHQRIGRLITSGLAGPYDQGLGGPGDWWILPEPGIELPGSPEFAPDVGGWRKERMPELPEGPITLVPDWICEVHSPSTRRYDRTEKRDFYARIGVRYLWLVDQLTEELAALRLAGGLWQELGIYIGEGRVRAEPFEGVEIDLQELWLFRKK